jgi:uncharacterized DUF497 family protein
MAYIDPSLHSGQADFEWDENKSDLNIDKHGISFEEAREIWLRPDEMLVEEDEGDYDEDRFLAWGLLADGTLIVVVHTYRNERIRIISAREAEPKETRRYYEKIHRAKW